MNISVAFANVRGYVTDWAIRLCRMIDDIRLRERVPILIALSRKMPRFIEWIVETNADRTLPDNVVATIKQTELTTELAIPFIFQTGNTNPYEFIILDDIIIRGTTLRNVANDLLLLSGKTCHVSCILRHEDSQSIEIVDQKEFIEIPVVSEAKAEQFIHVISSIVESTQLPIDMEFPVFDISGRNADGISKLMDDILSESETNNLNTYEIGQDNTRFSLDIDEGRSIGYNNDFTKVRFFKRNDRLVFEVLSPMIFSQSELLSLDDNLFDNSFYQTLWDVSTIGIRRYLHTQPIKSSLLNWDQLKSNFSRTLCVWASYLYSVSTYVKNKAQFLPENAEKKAKLSLHNLELILGRKEALSVYSSLETLLSIGISVFSLKEKVMGLPPAFAPKAFQQELASIKIISSLVSATVADALQRIFAFQHYDNSKFNNPLISTERPFFGETHDSLIEAANPSLSRSDALIDVRKWVDENIDAGYVVPKYECVRNRSGVTYWRRYFHPGIRKRHVF